MLASSKRRLFCDSTLSSAFAVWRKKGKPTWPLRVETQSRVPSEVYPNLFGSGDQSAFLVFKWLDAGHSHINGKFTANPNELGSVQGQLLNAGDMGFQGIDGICSHDVYGFKVFFKHVRTLIIFGGYVLLDGSGHGDCIGPPEGQE